MIPEIVPLYEGIAFQRVHKVGRNINPDNMPILPPNTQQKRAGLTIKEEKKRRMIESAIRKRVFFSWQFS